MMLPLSGHPVMPLRAWVLFACSGAAIDVTAAAGTISPSTDEAVARGLIYIMQEYPQADGLQGFGCGFVDLDADGDPDVVLLGSDFGAGTTRVGLFENDGTGHFTNRSATSGIPLLADASGFAAADYDGDGLPDLYLTQMGLPNVLARNDGGFQFTDVSAAAHVDDAGAGTGACFGDFDGDTRLDLYVCNYNGAVPGTEFINNKLYRNEGDGSFTEVGAAQTVDHPGYGFQSVWFDMELDGDLDLYLSNDRGHLPPNLKNQLWRNDGGQLVNVSAGSGADLALFSMGLACGDFGGNGYPDLYCTNLPGGGGMDNPLMLNLGNGAFFEFSVPAGVNNPYSSWGSVFYDFDNDTRLDLYVNNLFLPNTLYVNLGAYPCAEVGAAANVTGNDHVSYCAAVGDVDDDGDLDLLVNNLSIPGEPTNVQLFINNEGSKRKWVKYRVVGLGENKLGVGARIRTRTGMQWQLREVLAGGNGYLGQNQLTRHVGLASAVIIDEVEVTWPGGSPSRTLTDLPVEQTWTLYPPSRLGDQDGDGIVVFNDFQAFAGCYGGGFAPGCEMMDFDGNSDISLDDFDAFLAVYAGPQHDCNGNGEVDLLDLLLDPGLDKDADGIRDACEAAGDVNGDGTVGIVDLLIVLGGWGPCPAPPESCPGDVNNDGMVGVTDLLTLLGNWDSTT